MQNAALIQLKARRGTAIGGRAFVEGYVVRQNVDHYRAMLKSTTDPEKRLIIEKLLLEEEVKLKKYNEEHKPNSCNQVA